MKRKPVLIKWGWLALSVIFLPVLVSGQGRRADARAGKGGAGAGRADAGTGKAVGQAGELVARVSSMENKRLSLGGKTQYHITTGMTLRRWLMRKKEAFGVVKAIIK